MKKAHMVVMFSNSVLLLAVGESVRQEDASDGSARLLVSRRGARFEKAGAISRTGNGESRGVL